MMEGIFDNVYFQVVATLFFIAILIGVGQVFLAFFAEIIAQVIGALVAVVVYPFAFVYWKSIEASRYLVGKMRLVLRVGGGSASKHEVKNAVNQSIDNKRNYDRYQPLRQTHHSINNRLMNKEAYAVFSQVENMLEKIPVKYRLIPELSMVAIITPDFDCYKKTCKYNDAKKEAFCSDRCEQNYKAHLLYRYKRFDMVVIDPFGLAKVAIEYNGSGHYRGNAKQRDMDKEEVCNRVGLPFIQWESGDDAQKHLDAIKTHLNE